jgi:hypothetical protein
MRANGDGSVRGRTAHSGEQRRARGLAELRTTCWRQTHQIHALTDTIEVLRAGANSLAIDNAILRLKNELTRAERGRPRDHTPSGRRPAESDQVDCARPPQPGRRAGQAT